MTTARLTAKFDADAETGASFTKNQTLVFKKSQVSEQVSSFLTAYQHNLGYIVPVMVSGLTSVQFVGNTSGLHEFKST